METKDTRRIKRRQLFRNNITIHCNSMKDSKKVFVVRLAEGLIMNEEQGKYFIFFSFLVFVSCVLNIIDQTTFVLLLQKYKNICIHIFSCNADTKICMYIVMCLFIYVQTCSCVLKKLYFLARHCLCFYRKRIYIFVYYVDFCFSETIVILAFILYYSITSHN